VDSPEFRKRARKLQLSDNPDVATVQTVEEMCRLINEAAKDPLLRSLCCVSCSAGTVQIIAENYFWWCKRNLKFKHHGEQFESWSKELGNPLSKLQLLIAPDVLLRMKRMEGDCAIYTMMLCAMLKASGFQYRIVTMAVDPHTPELFTHVCARVVLPGGKLETLDASHGAYPGWCVPKEHILREWTFDESGQRLQFAGLHDYRRSRFSAGMRGYRRGLGDNGGDVAEGGDYYPPTGDNPTQVFLPAGSSPDWGVPYDPSSGGYSAPSQNSTQWAGFAANLAKMGFTLAQINAIQPGTVVQPNGTIIRQTPGFAVPVGSQINAALGGSGNIILYAGLGLAALFIVGSMFKGSK
jgi:hypothetical protein